MKHAVKLTAVESSCRSNIHRAGESYIVLDTCPPVCHELWSVLYPMVFALGNGAELDSGDERALSFTSRCPDGGRVVVKGERI